MERTESVSDVFSGLSRIAEVARQPFDLLMQVHVAILSLCGGSGDLFAEFFSDLVYHGYVESEAPLRSHQVFDRVNRLLLKHTGLLIFVLGVVCLGQVAHQKLITAQDAGPEHIAEEPRQVDGPLDHVLLLIVFVALVRLGRRHDHIWVCLD